MTTHQPNPGRSSPPEHLPADLHTLDRQLEHLGLDERDAAPVQLEDRVFIRTQSLLHSADNAVDPAPAPIPLWRWVHRGPWRIAAGLTIAASAIAAVGWFAMHSGQPSQRIASRPSTATTETSQTAELDAQIDEFLIVAAAWESDITGLDESLDLNLDSDTSGFWADDSADDALLEDTL